MQQGLYEYNVDSMILLIINSLMTQGDLKQEDLVSKLVCFGVDRVSSLRGFKSRVTIQIQHQYVLFVIGVHCITHGTNLFKRTFGFLH